MARKLIALNEDVIIEKIPESEKTEGGIYLPSGSQQDQLEGKVISVGPKVKGIKPGDIVIYPKYIGGHFKEKGKEYRIVEEKNIPAVVDY